MDYCVPTETFPSYTELMDAIGEAYSNILSDSATFDEAFNTLTTKADKIVTEAN